LAAVVRVGCGLAEVDRDAHFAAKLDDDDFLIDVMERVRAFIDPDTTT
jgi:hypothetical protein